ncbi:MAG: S1C family serine protease [Lachnospiraceae bacterium]
MDNQYSYYTPNDNDTNYQSGNNDPNYNQKPHRNHNKKAPNWLKAVGLGLIIGIVACVAFQTCNFAVAKIFGTTESENEEKQEPVESAKLTSGSVNAVTSDISSIAKNAMPSVVSITNMSVKQVQNFFGGIREEESTSAGSGIIIAQNDTELLILTNNHVVENNDTLTVSFIDEESVEANIKGTDPDRDLAVIAVQMSDIKDTTKKEIAVAQMGDSTKLQVGEPVIAIGNALGYGQSVTSGIVSATERVLEGFDSELIQTDAAINPGNSGGALLNLNGEVVGINTIKVATDAVEGMGYAIPISDAEDVITDLMNQKTKTKVAEGEQGYLGVQGVDVSEDSAQMYGMPTGVYVSEVLAGSGAKKAGITKGSIITKLEGTSVDSMEALKEQLQYYAAGETVEVTIQVPSNNGEYVEKTVKVTLGKSS